MATSIEEIKKLVLRKRAQKIVDMQNFATFLKNGSNLRWLRILISFLQFVKDTSKTILN